MNRFQEMANELDHAASTAIAVDQLSNIHDFNLDDAYHIQELSINNRYERGEKLVGVKMGFTSKAKMVQMGVHDLIWGRLTDRMSIPNEGMISRKNFIHPRAEPEICFRVCKDIETELNISTIKDHIDGISAAIEIIDSRYKNFKFSLDDVVADNCSSSGFVIGSWFDVETPIDDLNIELFQDGETVQNGNSSAIMGNPWESVVAATRLAAKYNQVIKKGSIILAGAATAALHVEAGQRIAAKVENLGEVAFHME